QQRRRGPGRRFLPGRSGNPAGRPKGARCKATMLAEQLLDGQAEALVQKAVELALAGDGVALRLCVERIIPPRRERPVNFGLPSVSSANDATAAMAAIVAGVVRGHLTPGEAGELSKLVACFVTAIEAADFDSRLRALEELSGRAGK